VFVDDTARPVLAPEDFHHLSRALRLRAGEVVTASDGHGSLVTCAWSGGVALSPESEVVYLPAPSPPLTVAFSLTKGERPEWAVQKMTEAGVDRIVLMTTARSVVRWDATSARRHVARLLTVARQAAMQSRRAWLPALDGPLDFAELAGCYASGVALAVPGGAPLHLGTPTVLIGPEGGWSDEELSAVPVRVGLGPHVLRAETAAVAAGVLLAALRGGMVAPMG